MRWMNTALSAMLLTVLMVGSPAHAQNRNRNQPDPPPPKPDTAMTAVAPAPPAGGLWSEVRARQLMGIDGSARQVGDKITVRILERSYTSLDANTNTSRNSSSEASITSLFGAEKTLAKANPNLDGGVSLGVSSGAAYDGGGSTTRGSALEDILTCEVVEVLPNGDLRIWGQKEIKVN